MAPLVWVFDGIGTAVASVALGSWLIPLRIAKLQESRAVKAVSFELKGNKKHLTTALIDNSLPIEYEQIPEGRGVSSPFVFATSAWTAFGHELVGALDESQYYNLSQLYEMFSIANHRAWTNNADRMIKTMDDMVVLLHL